MTPIDEDILYFIMYNSKIYRNTQTYLDKAFKKYELSSGSFPYLFNLENNEGISQNKISKLVGNDKAMSARTITRLVELGYVYKIEDESDCRAYRLYLTEKAKAVIPKLHDEIYNLADFITKDLTEEEKKITMMGLKKIFGNTQKIEK